jgi:GTP pyrophosphokinase
MANPAEIGKSIQRTFQRNLERFQPHESVNDYILQLATLVEGRWTDEDLARANSALKSADEHHRGQRRDSGEPYLSHAWNTGRILMEEARVFDVDVVMAAFLHDVYEDSREHGQKPGERYSTWKANTSESIAFKFGERVASIVMPVTKPKSDGIEIRDRHHANLVSRDNLRDGPPEAILVKMADRLHNLRTLSAKSQGKQLHILTETLDYYMSIFRLAIDKYPREHGILAREIFDEIGKRAPNLLAIYPDKRLDLI